MYAFLEPLHLSGLFSGGRIQFIGHLSLSC